MDLADPLPFLSPHSWIAMLRVARERPVLVLRDYYYKPKVSTSDISNTHDLCTCPWPAPFLKETV